MASAQGPCPFGRHVTLHRQILDREGFPDVPILAPSSYLGYAGLEGNVRRTLFKAILVGDFLMKAGCGVRPHEREAGETSYRRECEVARLAAILEAGRDVAEAVAQSVRRIAFVPVNESPKKPLVGTVGEVCARNDVVANGRVVHSIERIDTEARITSLAERVRFTASTWNGRAEMGHRVSAKLLPAFAKWQWLRFWERTPSSAASPFLDDRHEPDLDAVIRSGLGLLPDSAGSEWTLAIGRAIEFVKQKAAMAVNVAPFSCMPGTITTALFREVSAQHGTPIVNLFYEGTVSQNRNLELSLRPALSADGGRVRPSGRWPRQESRAGWRGGRRPAAPAASPPACVQAHEDARQTPQNSHGSPTRSSAGTPARRTSVAARTSRTAWERPLRGQAGRLRSEQTSCAERGDVHRP